METSVLFCMLGLSHLDSTTRQCQMENKALHVTVIVSSKESTCQCSRCKRCGLDPWVGKITWRRKWQSTSVFLPGKSHGQRCLAGYSPWGHKNVRHDLGHDLGQQQQTRFGAGVGGTGATQRYTGGQKRANLCITYGNNNPYWEFINSLYGDTCSY